ncbi:MAG: hypothetical protein WKF97_15250 [Chitinophagaceae bacterium]
MSKILSLGFQFDETHYSFLAHVKEKDNRTEYHITVMNGELEKVLYGDHVILEINGQLQIESPSENNKQQALKHQIAESLIQYLKRHQPVKA